MLTNIFKNLKTPYVQSITDIPSVLSDIKTGKYQEEIMEARAYGKGHEKFESIKQQIPTFSPNGCFKEKRSTNNIRSLSGLIYLDIDNYTASEELCKLPFVYSCWKSFSGNGIGVLVSVSGVTIDSFKQTWTCLNDTLKKLNIDVDPHTKDISRQCVISYDPEIYINPAAIPLKLEVLKSFESTSTYSTTFPEQYSSSSTYEGKIKYKTTLDDYGGKDYIIIEEGKESRNVYLPKEIFEGQRHKWMSSFISTILYNNPSVTLERLVKEVQNANVNHCYPPLRIEEVVSLVKWSFNLHIKKKLCIQTNIKKIWFNPESKLSTKEKRIIVGQETGNLRKQKTVDELANIYLVLQVSNQKVTQKLLESKSNKSIRTIKKYWKEIKEKVHYVKKEERKGYIRT